jgi:hypothetical protein
MQKDKTPLDIDLTFLDLKPRREALPPVDTGYRFNWKNIAIIATVILGIGTIAFINNDPPRQSITTSPSNIAPSNRSPSPTYDSETVSVGEYRCSRSNSNRAAQLRPTNGAELDAEQQSLERRSNELTTLHLRIESSAVSPSSSQVAIDRYNAMVDEYNALLRAYRSESASTQVKIAQFNTRVDSYNAYLRAHCTRR